MMERKSLDGFNEEEAKIEILPGGKVTFQVAKNKLYDYEFTEQNMAEDFAKGLQRVVELFMEIEIPINKKYLN